MTYLEAVFLGIIQGLTEFLPISSSGHLVLVQEIMGVNPPGVIFELLAHLGTLVAVLVYFRTRIFRLIRSVFVRGMKSERRLLALLVVGTLPVAFLGLIFNGLFERVFSNPVFTSAMLLVTGAVLLSTRFVPKRAESVGWFSAVIIGLAQAAAVLPGISRSGTTIATGMMLGVKPREAAEYSFLLAIPAIAGAVLFKSEELIQLDSVSLWHYLAGALSAFVFGLIAVYGVLATIRRGKFEYFAYYCFAVGVIGLYLFI